MSFRPLILAVVAATAGTAATAVQSDTNQGRGGKAGLPWRPARPTLLAHHRRGHRVPRGGVPGGARTLAGLGSWSWARTGARCTSLGTGWSVL